jgi:hypothetical protein
MYVQRTLGRTGVPDRYDALPKQVGTNLELRSTGPSNPPAGAGEKDGLRWAISSLRSLNWDSPMDRLRDKHVLDRGEPVEQ